VGAAIDKAAGAEREVVGVKPGHEGFVGRDNLSSVQSLVHGTMGQEGGFARPWMGDPEAVKRYHLQTAPATDEAKAWDGWGTALKPAWEPVLVGTKP
jgi:site-specific DNA-methyltransferase (adenine-specific)